MKKETITISGISRNSDDTISKDGACMELINARVKDGSIIPVGRPIQELAFPSNHQPVYVHVNSGYEHYIGYDNSTGKVYYDYKKENGAFTSVIGLICIAPSLKKMESIGNTLIIITDSNIIYALFKGNSYLELGSKPPFPVIPFTSAGESINKLRVWCDIEESPWSDSDPYHKFTDTNTIIATNTILGTISKLISTSSKRGLFVFPFLVRYALRLYDGSYISHSAPVLILPKGKKPVYVWVLDSDVNAHNGHIDDFYFTAHVKDFVLQYQSFRSQLGNWKDIVSGIDVFVSKQIYTLNTDSKIEGFTRIENGLDPDIDFYGDDKIINDITAASVFYKIHTFDIRSSYAGGTIANEGMLDNLEQKETLSDDPFSHNTITGESYVYNARLHLGAIKNTLYEGYSLELFENCYNDNQYGGQSFVASGTAYIYINSDSGEKIVSRQFSLTKNGILPFLSYPDARAYKIVLVLSGGKRKTFTLKPHTFLNLSYSFESLSILVDSSFTESAANAPTIDNVEISGNKIRVSEVNNPFFFPSKNTYTPGAGKILAMCSNTTAISQGQFGQYPLYCFCSDGIYALMVGSNGIAYSSSSPVSRDVCSSPKSVTPIDNAVVFSSNAGIMLISGSEVRKISKDIDGYLPSCLSSSPVIRKILGIPNLKESTIEFRDYIKNAMIGYIYEEKEVIVSNETYPHSYVYNMGSDQWYKISSSISRFLNAYPQCLAVYNGSSGQAIYNMYNPHRTVTNIALITRPIKLGTLTHKRILQAALRGVVKPSLSDVYLRGEPVMFRETAVSIFSNAGFYVLGANDAEHFQLVSGREKIEDIRDLITKMNKSKAYKYFMLCVVGGVRTDVAINYIELIVDETYDNRLR